MKILKTNVSLKEFKEIVKNSNSVVDACISAGVFASSTRFKDFYKFCAVHNISCSHLKGRTRRDKNLRLSLKREDIINACIKCNSIAEALRFLKMNDSAQTNTCWLKRKIETLKISTEHWLGTSDQRRGKKVPSKRNEKFNYKEWLESHSGLVISSDRIKKMLYKQQILTPICSICNITCWLEKPITLQLDHTDGNSLNNELDNLRILCPNCHSQTKTYCVGNKYKPAQKEDFLCVDCGTQIWSDSIRCNPCSGKQKRIDWPSDEVILKLMENSYCAAVSRKLGVSAPALMAKLKKINKNQ